MPISIAGHGRWGRSDRIERRLTEAADDLQRAIAAKERALGPDAADVGISIGALAGCFISVGDHVRALDASGRAIRILSAGFGPEHQATALYLSNHGEFLCRLGRFAEAREPAARALTILERETDPRGLFVSYALLTRLAEVHFALARAVEDDGQGGHDRAVSVARQARREYEQAPRTPIVESDLTAIDRWLAAHAPEAR